MLITLRVLNFYISVSHLAQQKQKGFVNHLHCEESRVLNFFQYLRLNKTLIFEKRKWDENDRRNAAVRKI